MLGERIRVRLGAELVQQPRRALDVGEDKGDGAGRQVGPHAGIIRPSSQASKEGRAIFPPHLPPTRRHQDRCVERVDTAAGVTPRACVR